MTDQGLVELSPERRLPIRWWPQIAALLLIVVELGWVVPWYQMLSGLSVAQPLPEVILVLGGSMAAAYGLTFAIEELRLIRQAKWIALGALLLLEMVVANAVLLSGAPVGSAEGEMTLDPGFLITILCVAWLWWRGIGLGNELIRPQLAWRRFQVGLVALMAYTFIAVNKGMPGAGVGAYVLYLFTGLLAVVLSRISYVSITRSARRNPFDRRWMTTTGVALGGTILLAAAFAGLLTGQFRSVLDALAVGLRWVFIAVVFLLSLPAILVSYLFLPLAPLIERLIRSNIRPEDVQNTGDLPYPYPFAEQVGRGPLPIQIQMACFWITLALVVLFIFLRARQTFSHRGMIVAEGPESLLSEGQARGMLRKAFQDYVDGLLNRLRPAQRIAAAARIRRIYAELLDLSAGLDHPRPESSTPLEFLVELDAGFPGFETDLDEITRAYIRVRYGEYPETPEEVGRIEAAWSRVAAEGLRLKNSRPAKTPA